MRLTEALTHPLDAVAVAAAYRRAAGHFDGRELGRLVFACVAANARDRLQLAVDAAAGGEAGTRS